MYKGISRRDFLKASGGLAAGGLLASGLPAFAQDGVTIRSHTRSGRQADAQRFWAERFNSVTPVVAAAFLWLWIFQPQIGLLNSIISALGFGDGPLWLGHPGSSKPALIIISLWGALGGNTMLIFLAALQGIPKELYESADIDGAGGVGKFRYITVPSISPVILFNTVLGVIGALQMFTLAYVASSGRQQQFSPGGPLNSTLFYVLHLYNSAFDFWEMGYASALAWVFFVIVLAITGFQLWTSRRWVYYEGEDS